MNTPNTIRSVAVAVGAVWAVVLYASDVELPELWQNIVGNIPTVALFLAVAFDLWIWKLPVIRNLHSRPNISGVWDTTIAPQAKSQIPDGGDRAPVGTTLIEQTFWTLTITQTTAESESVSRAEHIGSDGGSRTRKVLTYTYTNTPQLAVRDRSPIHVGAAMLAITSRRPDTLTGSYWTDRLTVGDLTLGRRT